MTRLMETETIKEWRIFELAYFVKDEHRRGEWREVGGVCAAASCGPGPACCAVRSALECGAPGGCCRLPPCHGRRLLG